MVAAEENGAPLVAHFAASIVYDHRAAHSNFHPAFATSPEIDAGMGEVCVLFLLVHCVVPSLRFQLHAIAEFQNILWHITKAD
jgi:hypothetical protein